MDDANAARTSILASRIRERVCSVSSGSDEVRNGEIQRYGMWGSGESDTSPGDTDGDLHNGFPSHVPASIELSDDNPLRCVDSHDTPTSRGGALASSLPYAALAPSDVDLERIDTDGTVAAAATTAPRVISPPPLGSCLIQSEEEGLSPFPTGEVGLCMTSSLEQEPLVSTALSIPHVIMSYYERDVGIPLCDQVEASSVRRTRKYFDQPADQMPMLMQRLDSSLTILRLRQVAARLLTEGNLNLAQDAGRVDNWLRMLKLVVFSDASSAGSADGSSSSFAPSPLPAASGALNPAGTTSSSSPSSVGLDRNNALDTMCSALITRATSISSSITHNVPSASQSTAVTATTTATTTTTTATTDSRTGTEPAATTSLPIVTAAASLARPLLSPRGGVGFTLGSSGSLERKIVDILVKDVESSLLSLSQSALVPVRRKGEPSLAADIGQDEAADEEIICASPHPFIAPCSATGRIDVPAHWKGAWITFHPKSVTPSPLATLKFFDSKAAFEKDKPVHTFYGPPDASSTMKSDGDPPALTPTSATAFKSFVLTRNKHIYYRFDAAVGSDRVMLGFVPQAGVVHDKSSGSITLGDPKETDKSESKRATVVLSDCPGLSEGTWFFEVTVKDIDGALSPSADDGASSAAEFCRVGVMASALTKTSALSSTSSTYLGDNDCSLSVSSSGWVLDSFCPTGLSGEAATEGHGMTTASERFREEKLGEWMSGDVIGCLFEPSAEHCQVWFAKNGKWAAPKGRSYRSVPGLSHVAWVPAFCLAGKATFTANFGERYSQTSTD